MRIVAGSLRGRALTTPRGSDIRPTADRVREAVFSMVASRKDINGIRVLDLFAGTGAMGIEALSRGAEHAIFVDSGVEARGLIRGHIEQFGLAGRAKLLKRDATDLGPAGKLGAADLVFLDPPYGFHLSDQSLLTAIKGGWIAVKALIVVEERKDVEVAPVAGTRLLDRRVYGETAITLLEAEGPDA